MTGYKMMIDPMMGLYDNKYRRPFCNTYDKDKVRFAEFLLNSPGCNALSFGCTSMLIGCILHINKQIPGRCDWQERKISLGKLCAEEMTEWGWATTLHEDVTADRSKAITVVRKIYEGDLKVD